MGPAPQITADLAARAVIAAARAYGDDPVRAVEVDRGPPRRAVTAAAAGLSVATGATFARVAQVLQIRKQNLSRSRAAGGELFAAAVAAAEGAVRAAMTSASASLAPQPPKLFVPGVRSLPAPATSLVHGTPANGPVPRPVGKVRVLTAAAARRQVLEVLQLEPSTAPDIMEILNLGEGQVRHALGELCEEREITHTPLTAEGWRFQTWRVRA